VLGAERCPAPEREDKRKRAGTGAELARWRQPRNAPTGMLVAVKLNGVCFGLLSVLNGGKFKTESLKKAQQAFPRGGHRQRASVMRHAVAKEKRLWGPRKERPRPAGART